MSKLKLFLFLGLIALLIGSLGFYFSRKNGKQPKYRSEKVERGEVVASVTATGTLAALTTVKVGSQVSGIISRLYVDFNSTVKKGQLLAELDPTNLQAQLDQRKADLEKAQVDYRNQNISFERAKRLVKDELLSQSEYDTTEANVRAAAATVKQAEAGLRQAVTNLSYAKIESPIDGIVVDRQIDIGQTVAASFQAPTLFTIAQDLTHMQVSTSIDEADIGRIDTGKEANFSVDAFPDRTFSGKVSQIRLSPQVVNNVTTYPVLIDVSNGDLLLKPGMTANVTIPVQRVADALKIPNAALRFKPDPADLAETPGQRQPKSEQQVSKASNNGQRPWHAGNKKGGQGGGVKESTIYVMLPEGKLKPVNVQTLLTDGTYTAIRSDSLHEGDPVITGLETTKAMEATGGFSGRRRGM